MIDREWGDEKKGADSVAEARSKEIGVLLFKNAALNETLMEVKFILEQARTNEDAEMLVLTEAALDVIRQLLEEPWMCRDLD